MPTSFTVTSEADLNAALKQIDLTGSSSAPDTAYTITFAKGFTLTTDLYAINLASGDTLSIKGGGNTLDGGGAYRGFLDYAGNVSISNLTIKDAVARGGSGSGGGVGLAASGGTGIGGAGIVLGAAAGGTGGASPTPGHPGGASGGGGNGGGGGGVVAGGNGANGSGGFGGGGLGAGGAIFVQQGGSLSFAGGGESGGAVTAGTGVNNVRTQTWLGHG